MAAKVLRQVSKTTNTSARRYGRGKIIYSAGQPAERLYLVQAGTVHLCQVGPGGRRLILDTIYPGGLFGEVAVLPHARYTEEAETGAFARLISFDQPALARLQREHPDLQLGLFQALAARLARVGQRLLEMASLPVPTRLAAVILQESADCQCPSLELTQQELADMAGAYRETTTHWLNQFARSGLVSLGRRHIEVKDADELARVGSEG